MVNPKFELDHEIKLEEKYAITFEVTTIHSALRALLSVVRRIPFTGKLIRFLVTLFFSIVPLVAGLRQIRRRVTYARCLYGTTVSTGTPERYGNP